MPLFGVMPLAIIIILVKAFGIALACFGPGIKQRRSSISNYDKRYWNVGRNCMFYPFFFN